MLKARPLLPLALALIAFSAGAALAQSPLGIGTAEPSISTSGVFGGFFAWVNAGQQEFYRAMTGALGAMRENPWQVSGLVGLSFAYGVFHAAGPGHGKAVISSYMVANEVALRRGILLSFASALMQGLMAILLVGAAYLVLRGSGISMTDATGGLEIASFAVITAFGAWLIWRKAMPRRGSKAHGHVHPHGHEHHHHHVHADGEVCSACGHAHAPDPALLDRDRLSVRDAWSAVVAVGLRPCSGALIVLTFALLNGLYLGGVLSVLAMSLGTAITVAVLASMAVGAKGLAIRYAGAGSALRVSGAIELFGALCVFLIGAVLLTAALSA